MPGPMSAPNGDKSLTTSNVKACVVHGMDRGKCAKAAAKAKANGGFPNCKEITKRAYLQSRNMLSTGKTRR